jgi:hypothetical protein
VKGGNRIGIDKIVIGGDGGGASSIDFPGSIPTD